MFLSFLVILAGFPVFAVESFKQIPIEEAQWQQLKFNGIEPNKVSFTSDSIKVEVDQSASPLVHRLTNILNVSAFEVEVTISGKMSGVPDSGFEEDSFFRLGLVATGESKLGKIAVLFAPTWVKKLFELAPEGVGLDKIYFYNVATLPRHVNSERQNPKSAYIFERVIAAKENDSQKIKYRLKIPMKVAALWISIDGDNTRSKFTTFIKSIKLEVQ